MAVDYTVIGSRLKRARKEKNLTQVQLADLIGIMREQSQILKIVVIKHLVQSFYISFQKNLIYLCVNSLKNYKYKYL